MTESSVLHLVLRLRGGNIGFTVGGAQDVSNFRLALNPEGDKRGGPRYIFQPTSITVEGLFSEYYFDTNDEKYRSKDLFYPSLTFARCPKYCTGATKFIRTPQHINKSTFKRTIVQFSTLTHEYFTDSTILHTLALPFLSLRTPPFMITHRIIILTA